MYVYIYIYLYLVYIYIYIYIYICISFGFHIYAYGTHGNRTSCFKTEQKPPPASSERIKGYFCSDTVFNLSNKVLSQMEISVLQKGLGFVPTPNMINESDLRRDFNEFSRKMRCKWYFRDEPFEEFSEIPAFRPKST